ncbi:hypothetical protein Cob_v009471 [Colletotrichum orbiculare MAFF 240422]|uniref:Uncharacterized protein n=1 Tax=Colletotrichum orbiculare (strain 104-T / ATCC 96160 / CBS 514.97 / LARS 414 / MAFF 240422) TaxID=1213857 RepID=A0A484FGP0_COLOR|nr:hypothetical protein Cob_v009471 [Colletotrichum orbiculare MAFF 240422]
MVPATQTQSPFIIRLPREVRDAIYLQLWRSVGLRQHIIHHGIAGDKHFCRWSCTTDFEVEDKLQQDLENLRIELGISLGEDIFRDREDNEPPYARRLQSPWMNHWPCGERAFDAHGINAINGMITATGVCWKKDDRKKFQGSWLSPYMPMLLSCKLVSNECLQSIYELTTFVFTDVLTMQLFFGRCARPQPGTERIMPPAFLKHSRSLELSLNPDFPALLPCVDLDIPGIPRHHDVYDFHWLRIDQCPNLQSLKVWIASRSIIWASLLNRNYCGVTQFNADGLKRLLAPFKTFESVTISTPLSRTISPQVGYVDVGDACGVRLYKRGSGDRFHPFLTMVDPDSVFDGLILTNPAEEVRLALDDGTYITMKDL